MAENTAYAISKTNKCKKEVYTKEYIDANMPIVRSGSTAPNNLVGKDGDIYIQLTE